MPLGPYHFFTIHDPKERLICVAPFSNRVLHHALMNLCEPIFESFQIADSYACRRGRGTQKAVFQAFYFARRFKYCLKLDMKKYFDSIPHKRLLALLERKFKDKRLLALFSRLIASYYVTEGRGLPIGNLTSQHFANFYLAFFDHYAREELKIQGYVRYMDDILIFFNTREEGARALEKGRIFLQDNLLLELKPPLLCKTARGVVFLGFLVSSSSIRFSQKKKRRIKKKLKLYDHKFRTGQWKEQDLAVCAASVLAPRLWLRPRP